MQARRQLQTLYFNYNNRSAHKDNDVEMQELAKDIASLSTLNSRHDSLAFRFRNSEYLSDEEYAEYEDYLMQVPQKRPQIRQCVFSMKSWMYQHRHEWEKLILLCEERLRRFKLKTESHNNSENSAVLIQLAFAYSMVGELQKAVDLTKEAVDVPKTNTEAYMYASTNHALFLIKSEEYVAAQRILINIREDASYISCDENTKKLVRLLFSISLYGLGQKVDTEELYQEVKGIMPKELIVAVVVLRSAQNFEQGKILYTRQSIEYYEKMLSKKGWHKRTHAILSLFKLLLKVDGDLGSAKESDISFYEEIILAPGIDDIEFIPYSFLWGKVKEALKIGKSIF
jgi:tetratricopeptide (TPR) repeat protein